MAKVRRPFDVGTTAQVAALASIDDADEIARRSALNARGREKLARTLEEYGLTPSPGAVGNFLHVELGEDAMPLYERLLAEGVIVRPLHGFGAPTAIRISVGTSEEHALLAGALDRVMTRA
jgi:histidinol-phosphate aminotransferase